MGEMNAIFQSRWTPVTSAGSVTSPRLIARGTSPILQVFREKPTPPPTFQSRLLTRDTDYAQEVQTSLLPTRRLAVIAGAVIAAAGLVWAGFAVWQFYEAVARLTTFAQSAAV